MTARPPCVADRPALHKTPAIIYLGLRLRKASLGNLGDVKPVGEGVWEMREFFGPGWRMYYIQQGSVLIVMLGGGDKSSQSTDIAAAVQLVRLFKE